MSWLDWLFTPACPLCQRPTASGDGCFCRDCSTQLQPSRQANWLIAKTGLESEYSSPLPVIGWGAYEGTIRRSLRSLKYDRRPEIGETLGLWLGQKWLTLCPLSEQAVSRDAANASSGYSRPKQPTVSWPLCSPSRRPTYLVVPIPLHAARRQERGFNQAEVIARAFCDVTGNRLLHRLLRRPLATQPQFGLSARERSANVRQAFVADTCDRQRWPILLVDDIYTTGATVAAARQTLESQGWQVAAAIAVAMASMEQSS